MTNYLNVKYQSAAVIKQNQHIKELIEEYNKFQIEMRETRKSITHSFDDATEDFFKAVQQEQLRKAKIMLQGIAQACNEIPEM